MGKTTNYKRIHSGTINLNLKSLNEFLQFSGKFIWELDNTDVDEYYYMMVGKALSYSTRRKYQSAISSFLDYARSRYSGQLWQRYNINFPILFDKFNKHYHRKDDVDRVIIPPKKRGFRTILGCTKTRNVTF